MVILKWTLRKLSGVCRLDLRGLGYELVAGSWKHCNELLGSLKSVEFLDKLSNVHLFKKNFAPWS
jgi:hypothetical protein